MRERRRRSIRLKGYDYSQPGRYFITLCVQDRSCILGSIETEACSLTPAGLLVDAKWKAIAERFPAVELGPHVIMPNHMHGLIHITAPHPDDAPNDAPLSSIGSMMQWFKTGTTYDYIVGVKNHAWPPFNGRLWQRNYWEHIVRNEHEYVRIAEYIDANPSMWHRDSLHPQNPWTPEGRPLKTASPSG